MLALELAMDARPVRLAFAPMTLPAAGLGEQLRFKRGLGQFLG
jgi:hypothetical protein